MTQPSSATSPSRPDRERGEPPPTRRATRDSREGSQLGRAFANALARQDFRGLGALLHPEIELRALTPRRAWAPENHTQVLEVGMRIMCSGFRAPCSRGVELLHPLSRRTARDSSTLLDLSDTAVSALPVPRRPLVQALRERVARPCSTRLPTASLRMRARRSPVPRLASWNDLDRVEALRAESRNHAEAGVLAIVPNALLVATSATGDFTPAPFVAGRPACRANRDRRQRRRDARRSSRAGPRSFRSVAGSLCGPV
jgi:hypothetical protein